MTKKVLVQQTGGSAIYITNNLGKVVLKYHRDSVIMSLGGFRKLMRVITGNESFRDNFIQETKRPSSSLNGKRQNETYTCVLMIEGIRICRSHTAGAVVLIDEYDKHIHTSLEALGILGKSLEEYCSSKLHEQAVV